MRISLILFCFIGLLSAGVAADCDIDNKREIQVGVSTGVGGECSNSGSAVECFGEGDEATSMTCDGPEGSYSGSDLPALISSACGCAAGEDEGAADQLQQELGGM